MNLTIDMEKLVRFIAREQQFRGGDAFLYPPEMRPPALIYVPQLQEFLMANGLPEEKLAEWWNSERDVVEGKV